MVDVIGVVFSRFSSHRHASGGLKLTSGLKSSALVLGDEHLSRSLLFLSALTAASEMGLKVLFFTQSQIESLPVNLQGSSSRFPGLKPDSLKKIRFVYPKTLEELLEDVASLHELVKESSPLPSLLVIDGLERYIDAQHRPQQDARSAAAHLLALLHDTSVFLTENLKARAMENQTPCRIIVSYRSERLACGGSDACIPDTALSVLERYLQAKCTLEKARSRVEGHSEWRLDLSGPGLQDDVEHGLVSQWRVTVRPEGVLEFWQESTPKEEALQGQRSTKEVNEN